MEANENAMNRYNEMWRWPNGTMTSALYAKAAKTARYGCHLQDEVLVRLGATVEGHKSRHYGKNAQRFIDWMTK